MAWGDKYEEPGWTCPVINDAQAEINTTKESILTYIDSLGDAEDLDGLAELIKAVKSSTEDWMDMLSKSFENVRSAHSDLRDWGKVWTKRAEDAEKEIEEKDHRINELELLVEKLDEKISELISNELAKEAA